MRDFSMDAGLTEVRTPDTVRAKIEEGMASENNLHVPEEQLKRLEAAGTQIGKTPDEMARVAIDRMLEHLALQDLAGPGRGSSHAQRVDRKPSDAVKAVRDVRRGR
jgi:hypothetical protein